jgi:hypothetical protein
MELPKDVGFPLASSGATHYVVQIHYSNPQGLDGQTDASGFELCTEPRRKYEADVAAFGSQSFTIPATNQPYTRDCTITVPPPLAGKHLFAAMPHMHKLGSAMSTTLESSGAAPVDLGTVNGWSFDNQAWFSIDGTTRRCHPNALHLDEQDRVAGALRRKDGRRDVLLVHDVLSTHHDAGLELGCARLRVAVQIKP